MRSWSLVRASGSALASCSNVKGESDTQVHCGVGLFVCKLQRYCHSMLCFEVGDSFVIQVHVARAEVPARPALPHPVVHLLCNRQALRVVRDGLDEVPLRLIRVAEVRVRRALPARLPTSVAIARCSMWCSSALEKFPSE